MNLFPLQHPAAYWVSTNPVLLKGQQGYETDMGGVKTGDGVTPWNELVYQINPQQSGPGGGLSGHFGSLRRVRDDQTVIIPEDHEAVVTHMTVEGILSVNGVLTIL